MAVATVRVQNYRSIADSGELVLGPVTLITGRNNSGKSALIRALYLHQHAAPWDPADGRLRATGPTRIVTTFDENAPAHVRQVFGETSVPTDTAFVVEIAGGNFSAKLEDSGGQSSQQVGQYPDRRPDNFMVPVLARRKAYGYDAATTRDFALTIQLSDRNLTSQVSALRLAIILRAGVTNSCSSAY